MILESILKSLDMAVWELSEAFVDWDGNEVWTRPHPRLLSVGELAVHLTSAEIQYFAATHITSPLAIESKNYYPYSVQEPITLDLAGAAIYPEIKRVHEACLAHFHTLQPKPEDPHPIREGWTWEEALRYQAFHFAYHTGQIYSVRHLLGHSTTDN